MRCDEFEVRLHDLLDERQSPSADGALQQHARRCAACRDMLAVQRLLLDVVATTRFAAPANLSQRVAAALTVAPAAAPASRPTAARRSVARSGWWALASTAALLLLSLIARRSGAPVPDTLAVSPTTTVSPTAELSPTTNADPASSIPTTFDVFRVPFDQVARLTNVSQLAESTPLADVMQLADMRHWSPTYPPLRYVHLEPLADGLAPLRESMSAAVDAVRRTMPRPAEGPDARSSYAPADGREAGLG